jgi:hypothetical protein
MNVYWIGGSPCSGKSTITDRLAARYGWEVYRCDDYYYQHEKLITPANAPVWSSILGADCDGIWLRPVEQQIREELQIYREQFPFILTDLAQRTDERPVILEGAALLPELLAAHNIPASRCLWMVPTERFQREHYARRDWRHDVLRECSDPEQGWENWMSRDAGFARAVATDAGRLGYRVIVVDGSASLDDNERIVERHFGLR